MVGNLVQNQFTTGRDWPFGSAISLLLMGLVVLVMWALGRRGEELV
jgi:spermidine/putrescine transport system permease protein